MFHLTVRALFPHLLGYLVTYSIFGFLGNVVSRDPDYIVMAGIFLIAWAAGPALFVFPQRQESERFLRTLPVTRSEIVTARFLAQLCLLALCWLVLLSLVLTIPMAAAETALCLKFVCSAVAWSLVAAALAYAWTAHRGPSILAGILLNLVIVVLVVPFVVGHSRPGNTFDTKDTWFVTLAAGMPWVVHALLPAAGLWFFVLLMKLAAGGKPATRAA